MLIAQPAARQNMRVSLNDVEGVSSIFANGVEIIPMSVMMFIQMRMRMSEEI